MRKGDFDRTYNEYYGIDNDVINKYLKYKQKYLSSKKSFK